MAWDPLAQAPDTVRFIPFNLNMQPRFIVTVEFIDWKMVPEPHRDVSFWYLITSTAFMTGTVELSFPYSNPTMWSLRYSWSIPASLRASLVAQKAYLASSGMKTLTERGSSAFKSGSSTFPVRAERKPSSFLAASRHIPDFPLYNESLTSSSVVPIQEYIPIPVITTLFCIFQ